MRIADASALDGMSQLSVACWAYASTAAGSWPRLVTKSNCWRLAIRNTWTQVEWRVWTDDVSPAGLFAAGLPNFQNRWCLIVGTWDGADARVYTDGIDHGDVENGSGNIATAATDVLIFNEAASTNNHVGIWIFDVRIYERALSPGEVWQLYAPATRWDLYQPEPRIFVIPRSLVTGEVCWGHITGVLEENVETFTGNWTGTGSIEGAGDGETICLHEGEEMISEVVDTGTYTVTLLQNNYAVGDDVTLSYRHGATQAACEAAGWNAYVAPFVSLGYVQAKVSD